MDTLDSSIRAVMLSIAWLVGVNVNVPWGSEGQRRGPNNLNTQLAVTLVDAINYGRDELEMNTSVRCLLPQKYSHFATSNLVERQVLLQSVEHFWIFKK